MKIAGKNILVVGLGKTGKAVACFLKKRDANVKITDISQKQELGTIVSEIKSLDIPMELGYHKEESFTNADLIVLSPGVPHTIEPIQKALKNRVPVIGEIEFAFRFIDEPIIAITGTNGKTTTTTILGQMLKASGFKIFVCGNIGNPLIEYLESDDKADFIVLEISSFQLDTIDLFKPYIGIILNISEDHLDRYTDFNAYIDSKLQIFKNQKQNDFAILNKNDLHLYKDKEIPSKKLYFNTTSMKEHGAKVEKTGIQLNLGRDLKSYLNTQNTNLYGIHNLENIAAAAMATLCAGGNVNAIQQVIDNFTTLPHRIEYVTTINGVKFFDDSKATNVDAVLRALECFENRVILIMGGKDKGGDYGILKQSIKKCVKKLILLGQAKEKINASLGHITHTSIVNTMDQAVKSAFEYALPEDVVLLSPACSSFDMYTSYSERGEHFCALVKSLTT